MKKSQKGFAVFEALLILVAIGLVVFTGWYVVHGGGGKGCESECTQVTHNYTYQSQDFQESKVTGYPNNQLYWDVIQFKDLTKLEEWSKDTRHTSVTSVSYPQEKRDYYLQIFTGLWLNSVATPVY